MRFLTAPEMALLEEYNPALAKRWVKLQKFFTLEAAEAFNYTEKLEPEYTVYLLADSDQLVEAVLNLLYRHLYVQYNFQEDALEKLALKNRSKNKTTRLDIPFETFVRILKLGRLT